MGSAIKVRVSFTDDRGFAEALTSAMPATVEPRRPLTAEFRGMPTEHNGGRRFGFEIVFSEEFEGLKLTALEVAPKPRRDSLGDACFDPALRGHQRPLLPVMGLPVVGLPFVGTQ